MKWIGLQATFVHIQAKLGQENLLRMVRWLRWHCPPDTGFEIRALAVWGRGRYLSVTEAPHNTDFHTWMGKKHFCFFQTAETGNRTPNSGVKGSGANHYPRAPAQHLNNTLQSRNTLFSFLLYREITAFRVYTIEQWSWAELNLLCSIHLHMNGFPFLSEVGNHRVFTQCILNCISQFKYIYLYRITNHYLDNYD